MRFDIERIDGKIVMSAETFENIMDIIAYDAAKAEPGERLPLAVLDAMLAGENPVRVFRKYRGMTQAALAKHAGVSQPTIADIEAGKKEGSVSTLKKIAAALSVDLDDIA